MATTYSLEEFDDATRDYLVEVRDREGRGTPGVFAPVSNPWPGVGCIVGPIIIAVTLGVTFLSNVILDDPGGVALLQTAGLLLGGWMFTAAFRVWMRKGSRKVAGHWVYADPVNLYEARGEQVKVTPTTDVVEAQYTHNYNNGSYQNSVVRLLLPGNRVVSCTLSHEQRAENIVVFYNYLAWARGPEGGDRAHLPAATLGGLAKYVAKNDNEPLDAEGNVNLDVVELEVGEVPEEPHRQGRALPNILPYLVLIAAGVACFFVMKSINVPYRDDEIYKAVTQAPMEPRVLRAYLVDPRNTRHREDVLRHLEGFYTRKVIPEIRGGNGDPDLKEGMIQVLDALKQEDQPVVSIRVTETKSPAGKEGEAAERAKTLRTGVADKVLEVFKQWEGPVSPPPGMVFKETPPPVGEQLIAFVEAPEDAKAAHFEITYEFVPAGNDRYTVSWTVTIRDKVATGDDQQPPPAAGPKTVNAGTFNAEAVDSAVIAVRDAIAKALIGSGGPAPQGNPFQPKFPGP